MTETQFANHIIAALAAEHDCEPSKLEYLRERIVAAHLSEAHIGPSELGVIVDASADPSVRDRFPKLSVIALGLHLEGVEPDEVELTEQEDEEEEDDEEDEDEDDDDEDEE